MSDYFYEPAMVQNRPVAHYLIRQLVALYDINNPYRAYTPSEVQELKEFQKQLVQLVHVIEKIAI